MASSYTHQVKHFISSSLSFGPGMVGIGDGSVLLGMRVPPSPPLGQVTAAPLVWLTLVAALLTAVGLEAFRRRDVE